MTRSPRFLVLVSILLVAACGGGSPGGPQATAGAPSQAAASTQGAQPASTAPDSGSRPGLAGTACELLSDADIVELTPFEVGTVEARSAGGIYTNGCYWTLVEGSTGEAVQAEIILGVLSPGGREHYDTVLAPYAASIGAEPIDGVGDVAVVGNGGESVTAVDDDVLVDLQWIDLTSEPTRVPVELMLRALANLAGD